MEDRHLEACCDVVEYPNYQTRNDRVRLFSATGNGKMNEYSYIVEQKGEHKGRKNLEKVGETNVYEKIQADKDSCDINKIIARFVAGDTSALDRVKGMYMDTTDFPENYAEFLQRQQDANKLFDRLPLDTKEAFNNSADEFWSQFGSESWANKLGLLKDEVEKQASAVQPTENQVKENNMESEVNE